MSDTDLTRREFIRLASGLSAGLAAGALGGCTAIGKHGGSALQQAGTGGIDYGRARAVPTICFGCTTHCGVIGWVQDERVRLIEGNPLDPNSQGTVCSKANGMVAYTYNPERILYPLQRV